MLHVRQTIALVAAAVLLPSYAAHATNGIACTGSVELVGVHSTNRIMLRLSNMNAIVQICSLGGTIGTTYPVTSEQCRAAYSTLLTAQTTEKVITVWFDNVVTGTSCSTFAQWEVATARWVYLTE